MRHKRSDPLNMIAYLQHWKILRMESKGTRDGTPANRVEDIEGRTRNIKSISECVLRRCEITGSCFLSSRLLNRCDSLPALLSTRAKSVGCSLYSPADWHRVRRNQRSSQQQWCRS